MSNINDIHKEFMREEAWGQTDDGWARKRIGDLIIEIVENHGWYQPIANRHSGPRLDRESRQCNTLGEAKEYAWSCFKPALESLDLEFHQHMDRGGNPGMSGKETLPELAQLGKRLSSARRIRGLTQKQLATRTETDPARISRIESGEELPTLPQLIHFARVLTVSLQWFINGRNQGGTGLSEIAVELQNLGVVDLFVPSAVVPGAFRATEEVLAIAVSGDQPEPRIIEAIPAVLAWNNWSHTVLRAYSQQHDPRAGIRLAWLADVVLTIEKSGSFPGGCLKKRELEVFVRWWARKFTRSSRPDDLGCPADENMVLPPAWKRWNINYAADTFPFLLRATILQTRRQGTK